MRIESPGAAICYVGAGAASLAMIEASRDVDLLICAAVGPMEGPPLSEGAWSRSEAVRLADAAGARALLLPGAHAADDALAEHTGAIRDRFVGPVYVARPGLRLDVGRWARARRPRTTPVAR